jgi:response regulator RpfG family c-di-GMP phosphodiesterase
MTTENTLRLLIIEDSENDAFLLLREIKRLGYGVESTRVETAEALRSALASGEWDLIVCDYSLPHLDAMESLKVLKSTELDIPFIIISGTIGEENAVTALKAGAHDFLVKGKFARLGPAIERELRDAQVRRDRRRAELALRENEQLLSESQRIGHIGSWSLDLLADKLHFSEEMYRLLDVAPQEFAHTGGALVDRVSALDRPVVSKWIDDIRQGRQTREIEFRLFLENGELRYIQCRGALIYDPAAHPVRFVGTAQDISERKLSEIQIRQQIARLTALRNIDLAITSSFNLQFALGTVLTETSNQLQVDAAAILLLHPKGQALTYTATQGFRSPQVAGANVPLSETYAGQAIGKRRLIRIENLQQQPDGKAITELLEGEGFISYFGVPLISKGKILGVLEAFHRTELTPYPEWINFLETIAGQAAIAVDNFTLFENLQQSNLELAQAYDATIEGWSHALDLRDKETEGHTQRVTEMSQRLARIMGIKGEALVHMRRGALLHDIGKMGVPDSILLKPGEFTPEEWDIMCQHPRLAYEWLAPIAYLQEALVIPYCHHEHWDGSGYPRGLKGEEIPLAARIFSIVDEWDALTSDRPYRAAWTQEKAAQYIRESSGTRFDPNVVEFFMNNLEKII